MKPEIIAHRGLTCVAPENSLRAIRAAWYKNVSVEIDIRHTRDKKIVVVHDSHTKRVLGRKWHVRKTPLKKLTSRRMRRSDQIIPTLSQVLKFFPIGEKRLLIEIKCGPSILPILKHCLISFASDKLNQIAVISFDINMLAQCAEQLPKTNLYWTGPNIRDHWDVPITGFLCRRVNEEDVEVARQKKKQIFAWTINSPLEAKYLAEIGVDGIVTDRPLQILAHLKRRITY